MNDQLDDRNLVAKMDGNHVNRNFALHDQNLFAKMDGNHDRHLSDLLDDHLKDDDHHDVLVCHRTNVTGDRNDLNLDASRVNRNYVRRGRKTVLMKCHLVDLSIDPECYVMSHRVMLMVCLSKSCDRMSRDHLRYDHQMMRRHDTNRMDVKNLDGKRMVAKMKNSGAKIPVARMI
jgi:hypothetical protein